jgi:hypothetical protein
MVTGLPVTVEIDGKIKTYMCQEDGKGTKYIQPNKKYVREEDCPMGEVIEI